MCSRESESFRFSKGCSVVSGVGIHRLVIVTDFHVEPLWCIAIAVQSVLQLSQPNRQFLGCSTRCLLHLSASNAWTSAFPQVKDPGGLVGYGKRFLFVANMIHEQFPELAPDAITVLDIGCGNGSCMCIPLALMGFSVLGVDPDSPSIEKAAMARRDSNCEFRCCTVQELPPDARFKCVILSEVLEHLHEPEPLLHAAAARIAESGILIVTTPNGHGEFEIDGWFYRHLYLERLIAPFRRHRDLGHAGSENPDGHVQFYSQSRLKRMFGKAGLRIIRKQPSVFACGPLAGFAVGRLPESLCTRLYKWNERVTDYLPMSLASGWYFALKSGDRQTGDSGH